jgi:hypothetical protein
MMTKVSVELALHLGAKIRMLRTELDNKQDSLDMMLAPFIGQWHIIEPVKCGHTGGWSLATSDEDRELINGDGNVSLTHNCFFAHGYDLHYAYNTRVPIEKLLDVEGEIERKRTREQHERDEAVRLATEQEQQERDRIFREEAIARGLLSDVE